MSKGTEHRGRTIAILGAIVLLGLTLRALYLADLSGSPLYAQPALDAELHDYWGHGIASGDWSLPDGRNDPEIPGTPFFRPPGYAYFLAAIYRVAGHSALVPRLAQFGLGLASCLLVFLLARPLGPPTALTASGMTAVSWTLIYFEGELLDPALLAFLTLVLLLALSRLAERPTLVRALTAGAVLGLFAVVRPNVLLFVPVAIAWVAWVAPRADRLRRAGIAAAGLLLAAAIVIAPVSIRNHRVSGEWILVSSNAGINLFIGNNPEADGINAAMPDIDGLTGKSGWTCFDYPRVVEGLGRRMGRPVTHGEASRFWTREAIRFIGANPGRFVALTAKRAALFWGPAEVGEHDVKLARDSSRVLRLLPLPFPFVFSMAVLGAALLATSRSTPRGASRTAVLVAAFVLTYFASYLPFFFNSRYRAPLLPLLFVFASAGLCRIAGLVRTRSWRRALAWSAAGVALWVLASLELTGYRPRPDEWHYQRGNSYRTLGKTAEAAGEYRESLRINPEHVRAANDLAVLLLAGGDEPGAMQRFHAILEIDPRHADARLNLAGILARRGRIEEAIDQYREAVRVNPLAIRGRVALGTALLVSGRAEEAVAEYREVLRLRPDNVAARVALGRAFLLGGRVDDAIGMLEEALRLDPDDLLAREILDRAVAARDRSD